MKRVYECEKCGQKFTDEEECLKHEETCTGLANAKVKTEDGEGLVNYYNNMSDEEYYNGIYKEYWDYSNSISEAVNG